MISRACRFSLPAWILALALTPATAAAQGATPGKGEDATRLEERMDIEIASLSSARVRYQSRTQVLTPRGVDQHDRAYVSYGPDVTIRFLRAAVVSPAGKRAEVKKQQIADGAAFASYALYGDSMVRAVSFPGVVPGSTVEYEYEQQVRNLFYLPDTFSLQDVIPARLTVLTVRYPSGFPIRLQARGGNPEHHAEEADGFVTQTWTVRDVPSLRGEDRMPPEEDVTPRVSISPKAVVWGPHTLDASSWSGVAAFYWSLAKERMIPGAEVSETAKALTAHLNEPDDKVRALFEFAQGKINYVSISLGIGGLQPHASGDVFKHRYGDCKDKATLMIAMLKAIGMVGYPVLILQRSEGLIDRDDPGLHFNHAIVAIPREEGYLFLDPTDEKTPYGDLPWVDQGVSVLVVKEGGAADFVETPLLPPDRNRRHRLIEAAVSPTGDLEGTYVIEAWGQRRVQMLHLLDGGPKEKEDALEDLVAWLCPGAVMTAHEIAPLGKPDDPLRVTIRFRVAGFVTRAGATKIVSPHLARVPSLTEMSGYPKRRHPVFFTFLSSETSEVRLKLPVGESLKKVPSPRRIEGPGLTSRTDYEMARDGNRNVLVVKRDVTVSRREIPPADYEQFRTFVSALGEEEAGAVTLVPAS
jgi:transglutaminase-like putative cysteine protease